MKKIYSFLIALLCVCATSCSNDDIEIEAFSGGSLTLRVKTKGVYDTFECTDKLRDNFLRQNICHIGVTSFLYNESGELEEKVFTTAADLNHVEQKFKNVPVGSCTVITVQMLVDPKNNNQYVAFKFEGEDNIRTLKISQRVHSVANICAIGINTQKVTISGKDQVLDIATKAIGSQVKVYYENIPYNFPYDNIGFGTTDILKGYLLDPSINARKDRFETSLSETKQFNLRGSLIVQEAKENIINTLYLLENNIDFCFCWQKEEDGATWKLSEKGKISLEDGKTYYAGIYFNDDQRYTINIANKEDFIDWLEEMQNSSEDPDFTPENYIYETPYVDWSNGTFSAVSNFMKGYNTLTEAPTYNEITQDYSMQYINSEETQLYTYHFTSPTDGLRDAYVYFFREDITIEDITAQLKHEGYNNEGYNEEIGGYTYRNETTIVFAYLISDESMWVVNYFDPKAYNTHKKLQNKVSKFQPRLQPSATKAKFSNISTAIQMNAFPSNGMNKEMTTLENKLAF